MPRQPVQVPGEEAEKAAAEVAAQPIPVVSEPLPDGLPNLVDVDASKLTAPLLTRQGWLVPAPKDKKG